MGDIGFEEQIELERLEREKREKREKDGQPTERVDPDGTVYEWDYDKKAWFPKIDAAFIAQYQMNYGVDVGAEENKTAEDQAHTGAQTYQDYYNYAQAAEPGKAEEAGDTGDQSGQGEYQEDSAEVMAQYTEEQKKQYNEYWSYYYGTEYHDYYSDCMAQNSGDDGNQTEGVGSAENQDKSVGDHIESAWNQWKDDHGHTSENTLENKEAGKKDKKRKKAPPKREEGWFKVEEKHNTNVYVSGLPPDMTEEEFQELMAKYGLIMFDPRTKKPKAKLYVDDKGHPKGDGRCCFIKRESVDLALNLLDGLEIRGHNVKVEMASFQLKGEYDPAKKKKKLSNKEKNRMRERQAKLFDWRPDKPRNARQKHEKVVILTNIFDAKVFEDNPAQINKVSADIRTECEKYGSVKKVVVYDRHQDGVVIVHFNEPEEADMCVEYMNRRFWGDRRIIAETWDGKTKYDVAETEAEREARIKKWEQYLESGGEERKSSTGTASSGGSQNGASVTSGRSSNESASDENNSANSTVTAKSAETTGETQGETKGETIDEQMEEAGTDTKTANTAV